MPVCDRNPEELVIYIIDSLSLRLMYDERELLDRIKSLIGEKRYRIRIHTVRHMIEEGDSVKRIWWRH